MNHTATKKEYAPGRDLATLLDTTIPTLADPVHADASLIARAELLRERLKHNRLQLAVLGQFKRGKSTFINALLGAPLVPIAVVPLTAVPIFISWRPKAFVRIRFSGERAEEKFESDDADAIREFMFRFVAEEANPENHLCVERVDLFYPAPALADGTVLIDTPGVGSTYRHNTEAAIKVLPECDAAFFVISADPPITETELEYLRRFESKTAKIIFVLNKIDYLRADERERVVSFLREVLERHDLWSADAAIFSVSARDGLDAKQKGDRAALERAIIGKAIDVVEAATVEVDLRERALQMPIEELASKSEAFERALRTIEEQRRITRDLLGGEQRRIRETLEQRVQELREQTGQKLAALIDEKLADDPDFFGGPAQAALSAAMEAAFERARGEFASGFATLVDSALSTHQCRIDDLVDSVRRTAAELFDVPFRRDIASESFSLGEEPYWVTESIKTTLIPDPSGLIDRLLGRKRRARRLRARMIEKTKELILRNAENLRWAILRGVEESFRNAGGQFEERLDDAIATTRGIIRQALTRRQDRSFAIHQDLEQLKKAKDALTELREEFGAVESRVAAPSPVHVLGSTR
jgi:GTP-binding protein EngB required for normal cell division